MLLFLYNILLPIALLVSFPFYLRRMLKRGGYFEEFFATIRVLFKRISRSIC